LVALHLLENAIKLFKIDSKGFFTDREDIPKYQRRKLILKNIEQGVCYLIYK